MPNASARPHIPSTVTRTRICVDQSRDGDYTGTVCNPFLPADIPFGQVKDAILALEEFFAQMDYPQAYYRSRSFFPAKEEPLGQAALPSPREDGAVASRRGDLATFDLEVVSRRNASWQGKLSWLEGGRSAGFRSVLELLRLIDSAVEDGGKPRSV